MWVKNLSICYLADTSTMAWVFNDVFFLHFWDLKLYFTGDSTVSAWDVNRSNYLGTRNPGKVAGLQWTGFGSTRIHGAHRIHIYHVPVPWILSIAPCYNPCTTNYAEFVTPPVENHQSVFCFLIDPRYSVTHNLFSTSKKTNFRKSSIIENSDLKCRVKES